MTIHPEVIQYYLQGSAIQSSPSTQVSSSSDIDDEEWEDIPPETPDFTMVASLIADEQATQFLNEGAKVPGDQNPFNHTDAEAVFKQALDEVEAVGHIPSGLGMLEEEWDEDGYSEIEVISSKRQGKKNITVMLPDFIWRPRAIRWCQALTVLYHTLDAIMDTE